jgi:dephospho-CoA kinase
VKSVAITGSFASGKSFILELLKSMGYRIFSCDDYVRNLYENEDIKQIVVGEIEGLDIFDKKKLIDIIYTNPKQRKKLEKIIHPMVRQGIKDFETANKAESLVFVEVPLLFESGFEEYFDYSVCVFCDENLRLSRALERKNFSQVIFNELNRIQLPQEEKIKKADFSIKSQDKAEQIKIEIKKIIGSIK